ncbi:MAG: bifunctional diguanylate cyclase/phosphodiesterase [Planctomycetota bacterium]
MDLASRDADHSIVLCASAEQRTKWSQAIALALGPSSVGRVWSVGHGELETALQACIYRVAESSSVGDPLMFVLADLRNDHDFARLQALPALLKAQASASFLLTLGHDVDDAAAYRTFAHARGTLTPSTLQAESLAAAISALANGREETRRVRAAAIEETALHPDCVSVPAHARDCLTELHNRKGFLAELERTLTLRDRTPSHYAAVMFLDVDDFKGINDSLGHEVGDTVLKVVAHRLRGCLRAVRADAGHPDTIGRLGGDEFAVLLDHVNNHREAVVVAERMLECFQEPIGVHGHQIQLGASIGVTPIRSEHTRPEHVLRDADTAMYLAKRNGKNAFAMFDESLRRESGRQIELERALRTGIHNGEFSLVYQPIVHSESGDATGLEALLRWRHPTLGMTAPSTFLEIADQTGVLTEMTEWILSESFRQMGAWTKRAGWGRHLTLCLNFSRRQMLHPAFYDVLFDTIAAHDFRPEQLCIEFKEDAIAHRSGVSLDLLRQIQARGVKLAVDNFGAGVSSLATLEDLRLDAIKIDRSCTDAITTGGTPIALIDAILTMARRLDIDAIAGGVSTNDQLATLLALGCSTLQGNLIAEPLTADEVNAFVDRVGTRNSAA